MYSLYFWYGNWNLKRRSGDMVKKIIILVLGLFIILPEVISQEHRSGNREDTVRKMQPMKAKVEGADTMLIKDLEPVVIFAWQTPPDRKKRRLIYNIKKVYPYAQLASLKLWEYEEKLKKVDSDRERRKLMKQAENELKEDFGDELKKLNFTQGRILLKLIDRETGDTSYELLQELRSKFAAFFWQSLARIFGYNLKSNYDPDGKDKEIEEIVRLIEEGKI